MARRILLHWAVARYREGNYSFGELAQETGLTIEEIMMAMSTRGGRAPDTTTPELEDRDQALRMFLASCRTLAEMNDDPGLLQRAEKVAAMLRAAGEL